MATVQITSALMTVGTGTWTEDGGGGAMLAETTGSLAGTQDDFGGYVKPAGAMFESMLGSLFVRPAPWQEIALHWELPGICSVDFTGEVNPASLVTENGVASCYETVASHLEGTLFGETITLDGFPICYQAADPFLALFISCSSEAIYGPNDFDNHLQWRSGSGSSLGYNTIENIYWTSGQSDTGPWTDGLHLGECSMSMVPQGGAGSPYFTIQGFRADADFLTLPGTIRNLQIEVCGEGPCPPFNIEDQDEELITLATSRGTGWANG